MTIEFVCSSASSSELPPGFFPGGVGVFLHGDIEDQVGYDIPDSSVSLWGLEDGKHPAKVNGDEGFTLFLWRHPNMLRGLVVKDSDASALQDAEEKFTRRAFAL